MKAITILQPWASLIACGAKKIETRGWETNYRGQIAIHAGKGMQFADVSSRDPFFPVLWDKDQIKMNHKERVKTLPYGKVIAIADLVDCYYIVYHPGTDIDVAKNIKIGAESMTSNKRDPDFGKYIVPTEQEFAFGDWTPGRYAWLLENVQPIDPVPARGMQRLWNWEVQP